MRFISPRTDFAFKKIFGSIKSKNICISFLNALLDFGGTENEIIDLEILNPWQAPKIKGLKDTYLDVKVKTQKGQNIIVEMQVLNVDGFRQRVLYNTAKSYANQIKKAGEYLDLNPVIALTIVDFDMFEESEEYIHSFLLTEKTNGFHYTQDFELVFVELQKFKKNLEEIESVQDKWIYFLKEVDSLRAIPDKLKNPDSFDDAFYIAETSHISEEELDILERKQIFVADQRNMKSLSHREGLEEGREEGLEIGEKRGEKRGEKKEKLKIAKNLLDILDDKTIADKTGLTEEEISSLRI